MAQHKHRARTARGHRLTQLRHSNAAGTHDAAPRATRTRSAARRSAINDSQNGR